MSLSDVQIMMFYGRPENVNSTHSIKFVTTKFLKNSFSVLLGSKNNSVYSISQKFWEDVTRTS